MNLGHDGSCDHPLQSPLPCRLLEEVVVCAGDLPSLPQPAERLITIWLFNTGRPATRAPNTASRWSGPFTASRVRFNPPGSPARRHHSRFSVRPHGWAKRWRWHSCLLPLPILKPALSQTQLHTLLAKRQCYSRGSEGKLSALSVTDGMLLRHLYNRNPSTVPLSSRKSQNPELRKLIWGEKINFTTSTSGSTKTPALPHPLLWNYNLQRTPTWMWSCDPSI